MATDEPFWNHHRERAEAFRLKSWECREFRSTTAIITLDGRRACQYHGEEFDDTKWKLWEGGWDHVHCQFCSVKISDADDGNLNSGYTSNNKWLCQICHDRIIVGGEDAEIVLREAGWQ